MATDKTRVEGEPWKPNFWISSIICFAFVIVGCAIGDWFVPEPGYVDGEYVSPSRVPFYMGAGIGGALGAAAGMLISWAINRSNFGISRKTSN